jgi:branched-chain amino acid transport system permease protein
MAFDRLWLGFRFGIGGVYFALLTIAFAEFTGIMVDPRAGSAALGRAVPAGDADRDSVDLSTCAARR